MNLYIYLPPNSTHFPDVIQSIIFGQVCAYFLHNIHFEDITTKCVFLVHNLIRCIWELKHLHMHFNNTHKSLMKQGKITLLKQAKKTHQEKEAEKHDNHIIVFPPTIISSKRNVMMSNLNSLSRFWFRRHSIKSPHHLSMHKANLSS